MESFRHFSFDFFEFYSMVKMTKAFHTNRVGKELTDSCNSLARLKRRSKKFGNYFNVKLMSILYFVKLI